MKRAGKLIAGWLLLLAGSGVSLAVMTSGGVDVRDVRIPLEEGGELAAYLYVPPNATPETAPPIGSSADVGMRRSGPSPHSSRRKVA